ncbi:MAG: Holliday junction branch migration protein RuvA [Gammaproteobacteria bacterium]
MIGRIHGILLEKLPPVILIDVAGVGYEINVSMYSFYRLPNVGAEVTLHTHLVTREDAEILYGFAEKAERALFRSLIKVSGIGPKSALGILSAIEANEFVRCVLEDNVHGLLRLPGVGQKTAQRMIMEMRDKLINWEIEGMMPSLPSENVSIEEAALFSKPSAVTDAISALIALGYKQQDARRIILKLRQDDMSSEDLIRLALKELGSKI